ncbi:rhodanese-like domain-containing protein [Austwickia chelonae]|uniref:rhodanese-like domain-containing protein n=1 Tax=Austwickia chelonae TaxID=100225 RepID=UPI000E21F825|nr:rhodanese-like domain-containing protein [Austwickia chelonae]
MTKIPAQPQPGAPTVGHAELADDVCLVDVREFHEWELGHAPCSICIPLGELEGRLDELPEEGRVVICCVDGVVASRAVAFLAEAGFDAVSLDGGMRAWARGNRPLAHSGPGAPEVR